MNRPTQTRSYRMAARADKAADTRRRILTTAIRQFSERPYGDVSLADIAAEAEVTVQTVLRRFGSKEGLTEAAISAATAEVRNARRIDRPGDIGLIVRTLMKHYEEWGERSLRLLSQEVQVEAIGRVVAGARALHHEWVDEAFAPCLSAASGNGRQRLRARLIAATDVYVWKIFRHDLGLAPAAAERTMRELVTAIVAAHGDG